MSITKEELKALVCKAIDARKNEIIQLAKNIFAEPELGYKEVKTAEKVESLFKNLDIP